MPFDESMGSGSIDEEISINIDFTSSSGNISSIEYNLATQSLYIHFRQSLYRFDGVPLLVANGFENASSATSYFNDRIRDRYSYEEL